MIRPAEVSGAAEPHNKHAVPGLLAQDVVGDVLGLNHLTGPPPGEQGRGGGMEGEMRGRRDRRKEGRGKREVGEMRGREGGRGKKGGGRKIMEGGRAYYKSLPLSGKVA